LIGISPELQSIYGVSECETVTFRQTTADEAAHRDAVQFRNGAIVGLQKLPEGQRVEVLSLSSEEPVIIGEIVHVFEWN
jgi:hypothetical protein